MIQIDRPVRRGRFRMIAVSRLTLHADAFDAYQVFLDAKLMRAGVTSTVEVIKDPDGRLLRFSGFQASYAARQSDRPVETFVWDSEALDDRSLALISWSDVCRPAGRLKPSDAARWYRHLKRRLPASVAAAYFGPRGLTHSSAARQLEIGRASLIRHLGQQP